MIPNDFIQTLLGRVDIVEVIDQYVPLKKAGANYAACCPFHSEKTPSFTVSPSKQFYHCFGCGAHGTAIGFLMEYAGKPFPEAVAALARDAGLEVPRDDRPGEAERREEARSLTALMLDAAKFYRARLKENPAAIDYLKARGLTGAIAARFGIGYAPDAWQSLAGVFPRYDDPALEATGLVIAGDAGKRYDRFRDRIMFPIHDSRGQVIGFGGRVIGGGEPKYLNSPETPLFSKGRELYGLFLGRNAIRDAGRAVVVEGYMDVVALAQHGIDYAVATLGTATTPTHVQKLFRLTDSVVFCFDGDAAGRKAAWRALETALPVLADDKTAQFLFLPDGEDPDDFIRRRGKAAFEALIAEATPLSAFLLRELASRHPPTTPEGRAALVAAARPLVGALTAPVLAAVVRRELAALAQLPEAEVRELLGVPAARPASAPARGEPPPGVRTPFRAAPRSSRRAPSLVRELLQGLLLQPAAAAEIAMPRPDDGTSEGAALAALVDFCASAAVKPTTAGAMQHFAGTVHEPTLVAALASANDQGVTADIAVDHLREGARRYWLLAQRAGRASAPADEEADAAMHAGLTPEETERLRQLEMARRALVSTGAPGPARDVE